MLDYQSLIRHQGYYRDNSVACQKKPHLPAHGGIRVAGVPGFFGYIGNVHDADTFGIDDNA